MLRIAASRASVSQITVLAFSRGTGRAAAGTAADSSGKGTGKERELEHTLSKALQADHVRAVDISGGCGALFRIEVVSPLFEGKGLLQQHKMVNEAIAAEIGAMHGLTLQTLPSSKWKGWVLHPHFFADTKVMSVERPSFGGTFEKHVSAIRKLVEVTLGGKTYSQAEVPAWVGSICKEVVATLEQERAPFKLIVHCAVMQHNLDAGFYASSSCRWEDDVDGTFVVRWNSDQLMCAVTVFGLAL